MVTGKVAKLAPWATVIVTGTLATEAFELEREIVMPPAPAGEVRLTVPVVVCPPRIAAGVTEMLLRAAGAGLMVKPAVTFSPK